MNRFHSYQFFTLKDGRRLCYAEFGDPQGFPIINCHGGLVCRLDIEHASECAKKLGVRIISIDRPGVGFSDFQPNRTQLDWAKDVKELCDHLKIPYFSVLGWSLGGQYAITCGHLLPDRVKKVGVIAGAIPLDSPEVLSEVNSMDWFFLKICNNYRFLAKSIFKFSYWAAKFCSRFFLRKRFSYDLPVEHYVTMFSEGVRNSDGVIHEYVILAKSWGFNPQDVKAPITWWCGGKDALIPPVWIDRIKKLFPQAKIIVFPNEGHFLASQHYEEIFRELIKPFA